MFTSLPSQQPTVVSDDPTNTLIVQKRQVLLGSEPIEDSTHLAAVAIGRAIVQDGSDQGQKLSICRPQAWATQRPISLGGLLPPSVKRLLQLRSRLGETPYV